MYGVSGSGQQTGISTPRSGASLRPLALSHGSLHHTFLIPTSTHFNASHIKDAFLATLPDATDELAQDEEPSSVPELVARYLGFIANEVAQGEDPEPFEEVLTHVLNEFERAFLRGNEVHAIAAALPGIEEKKLVIVKSYYAARAAAERPIKQYDSALFREASDENASIYAIFGGQGNIEEYFDELRTVWHTYPSMVQPIITASATLLSNLSRDQKVDQLFSKGIDIERWLPHPESQPDIDYLVSAPVSFPLIGLLQLSHYVVLCKVLGSDPGRVREHLKGSTGHSQGVVTAAAIAAADSWESFEARAAEAIALLFWIGCRSQQAFPRTSLAPSSLQDSINNGEGTPTPMLSIRDLSIDIVEGHIKATNQFLPKDRHIGISLINSGRNFVVAGPPISLYGLNLRLRKARALTGLDQSKIPHSDRKVRFVNRFLPITAPFHSPYLAAAYDLIVKDCAHIKLSTKDLGTALYHTNNGQDLRMEPSDNIVPTLIKMITSDRVEWQKATTCPEATHLIDFGPGGISGIGVLTSRNKEGTGVRVILAGSMESSNAEIGYKPELFDRDMQNAVVYAPDWLKQFGPKLVKSSSGTFVDTKMSRLMGLPPIMVAGMTPCTVPWDFVAATMNAGYEIELAGGGYYNEKSMTAAIAKVEKSIPPGRGITVNLIYVNPRAMSWQIPMISSLRANGVPIEGLTIGAGVPSIEVANEYIENLGIKRMAFKPGSVEGIQQVINIANANPNFPIILQWTGGRGGGHHSYEDMHQPMLQCYSRARRCDNLILVVGSGFGGSDDTYPYFTGRWSEKFGYPPMPFDGCLFGSRMMTAKEAHTSPKAKQAIVDAEGLNDNEWEKTYKGPAGGVITVRSEMGEPIHKLATRGVKFWAEMDQKIFSLDRKKRAPELQKNRDYIIKKLNDDYQKVWFAQNTAGQSVDLEDMTYAEVVRRMVDLMFVKHESRWIDPSHARLTGDFIRRMEERFTSTTGKDSLLQNYSSELNDPYPTINKIIDAYPEAKGQLINAQDVQHFLLLCQRRGQKPVPFVPSLDDNFEFWFKKDSLWQSEDLEAVVDQDVGRTAILQGPVAAKYSKTIDQPIKEILDGIHNDHIKLLTSDLYNGNTSSIPSIEYFGGKIPIPAEIDDEIDGLTTLQSGTTMTYKLPTAANTSLPDVNAWMSVLAGQKYSWRYAFFTSEIFIQRQRFQTNPMRRVLAPARGMVVEITNVNDPTKTEISVKEPLFGSTLMETVRIKSLSPKEIQLSLLETRTALGESAAMDLKFTYHPEIGYAPIHEVMEGRNDRIKQFYYSIWFGNEKCPFDTPVTAQFDGGSATVTSEAIQDFVHAVGNTGEAFVDRPGKTVYAPLDFAICLGWKAITKPIFPRAIDGDLLQLVHLSNSFRMMPGEEPLKKGDQVSTVAEVNAVLNQDAGKMVEVCGTISRNDKTVIEVTSQFLYRGSYDDFENTFQRTTEKPVNVHLGTSKDVAILRSKEWFQLENPDIDLTNQTLTFRLQSLLRFKDKTVYKSIETLGQVLLELPTKEVIQIASVEYSAGVSHGNPVMDYLQRFGSVIEQPVIFENAIPLSGKGLDLKAPSSGENYAQASGDYNPIHVSRVFSSYANLPGTITHGMYSSAAVRSLVETWAAENHIGRVRSFKATFVGMVLPDEYISVELHHVGMIAGRKLIKVEASNKVTEEKVLVGEAECEQGVTSFVFTGQGSQEQGMGMELYNSSEVAKAVWDSADKYLLDQYGKKALEYNFERMLIPSQASQSSTLSRTTPNNSRYSLEDLEAKLFVSSIATWFSRLPLRTGQSSLKRSSRMLMRRRRRIPTARPTASFLQRSSLNLRSR